MESALVGKARRAVFPHAERSKNSCAGAIAVTMKHLRKILCELDIELSKTQLSSLWEEIIQWIQNNSDHNMVAEIEGTAELSVQAEELLEDALSVVLTGHEWPDLKSDLSGYVRLFTGACKARGYTWRN